MGKFIAAIAAIAFGLFLLGRCSPEDTPNKKAKADMDAQALKAIKSEAKIKDAVITPVGVLYAGVISDGKNRDGYAQYLCEVLRQNSASAHRVKVVDIASVVRTQSVLDWVVIGEARCR